MKPKPPHTLGQSIDFITAGGGDEGAFFTSIIDGECIDVVDDLCANGVSVIDNPFLLLEGAFPQFTVTNPSVSVPTLSQWALLLMALSLVLMGGMAISRRRGS